MVWLGSIFAANSKWIASNGLLDIQIDFRNCLDLLYRVSLAPYWNGIKNTENFKLTLPAEKMHFYGKEYSRHGS